MSILKVSVRQVKAARALLGWSQSDLASAASISESTVKRVETSSEHLGGNSMTYGQIISALEKAGIEFSQQFGVESGVRLRKPKP